MKRLLAIILIVVSTSACAQHHHGGPGGYNHNYNRGYNNHNHGGNYAPAIILGTILFGAAVINSQPRPVYVQPAPVAPMYGDQCPYVNGYQTVPIIQYNRYGYPERVGCRYP